MFNTLWRTHDYSMSRGIGEIDWVQELIPDWMALLIGLLTQLGDAWFLVLVLAVLYWSRPALQDGVLLVMGMYVAGRSFYRYLKFVFELPRPDDPLLDPELVPWFVRPLYEATAFASGYGFPSGHAISATIVYFGLATVLTAGTRRLRYVTAAVLVAVVGFTRIALGVHYLVDIVVGVALGGVFVFVTFRSVQFVSRDRVTVVLVIAIVTAGLYVFESRADLEAVLALGIALGLFGGWQLVVLAREVLARTRPSQTARPIAVRGGLAALSFAPLVAALEFVPLLAGEPFPLGAIAGIGAALAVVLPIARYSPHVAAVLAGLSFWLRAALATLRSILRRTAGRLRSR